MTPESARRPFGVSLRTFDQRRSLLPLGDTAVIGDTEKSRCRSGEQDDPEAPEETMNAPIVIALVGLAISVSLPAFAQQKRAADPQICQQLDVLGQQYDAAFNNGDAAALAGTFTEDAVLVNDTGPVYGREAI